MTKREFLNAIVSIESIGEINAEVLAYAEAEITKMDTANANRRNKMSAKQQENLDLALKIVEEFLGDKPKTATEIGEAYSISTQKASALMRMGQVVDMIEKVDVKVKGKGTVKGYKKA